MAPPLLEVEELSTRFAVHGGTVAAVSQVSFAVTRGETVGIVGESGSGKSQLLMSVMGLLPRNGRAAGSVRFAGEEILNRPPAVLNRIRGTRIAMIFQDPMTALNPYLTVGRQLAEVLTVHRGLSRGAARDAACRLLEQVSIQDPARRLDQYPHQLSGGMRQRVMIAMGMLPGPELLLADEPTTALDVTVQAGILDLLAEQRAASGAALILVTHDLGVVAGLCDRVLVMYGGRIVESGPVRDLFADPRHPYTRALLKSMPTLDDADPELALPTVPGQPPDPAALPPGCAFAPRCIEAQGICRAERPPLRSVGTGRMAACVLA